MLLGLAIACGPVDTDVGPVGPQIETGRSLVDFGEVYANTTAVQWLKLENAGDEDLVIGAAAFLGGGEYFHVADLDGAVIAPGDNKGLKISFDAPDEKLPLHTVVTIDSNDPDGELWVDVMGTPLANAVRTEVPILDFGLSALGCTNVQSGTVINSGETPVTIDSVSTDVSQYQVDPRDDLNGPLPWTLLPTESATFDVSFSPDELGLFDGSVLLSSGGVTLVQQYLVGQGADHAHYTDRFTVDGGALDVMIPVQLPHATPPLATDPDPLIDAFPDFLDALDKSGVEYQIAVLASDDGCAAGKEPFLTWEMSRDEQMDIVNDMLDVGSTVGITHGLNLVTYAVNSTNIGNGGCNELLFRDEAKLAVIGYTFIGYNHPRSGWLETVRMVSKVKDNDEDVTYYGVLEDTRAVRGAACGYAAHSLWSEAVDYTGGIWFPICDDVNESMLQIADAMAGAETNFELSHVPRPETIKVTIGGAEYAEWTYDATTNNVVLGSTTFGREIAVDYDAASGCE